MQSTMQSQTYPNHRWRRLDSPRAFDSLMQYVWFRALHRFGIISIYDSDDQSYSPRLLLFLNSLKQQSMIDFFICWRYVVDMQVRFMLMIFVELVKNMGYNWLIVKSNDLQSILQVWFFKWNWHPHRSKIEQLIFVRLVELPWSAWIEQLRKVSIAEIRFINVQKVWNHANSAKHPTLSTYKAYVAVKFINRL